LTNFLIHIYVRQSCLFIITSFVFFQRGVVETIWGKLLIRLIFLFDLCPQQQSAQRIEERTALRMMMDLTISKTKTHKNTTIFNPCFTLFVSCLANDGFWIDVFGDGEIPDGTFTIVSRSISFISCTRLDGKLARVPQSFYFKERKIFARLDYERWASNAQQQRQKDWRFA
jgi:hypothetical protein